MNTIVISSGVNGGYLVVHNGRSYITDTLKYRIDADIEIYDSLDRFICRGSVSDFTIVINSVDNTNFATVSAVRDKLEELNINNQKVQTIGSFASTILNEPRTLSCEYTRPANTTARPVNGAINQTVSVIKELLSETGKQAADSNGGGGIIANVSLVSNNINDANRKFGIIFLIDDITPIIADNAVQTILYSNTAKRVYVIYVVLEAQPTGSDCAVGRFDIALEYQCKSTSKALKAILFDVTGGTTASESKYTIKINTQINK